MVWVQPGTDYSNTSSYYIIRVLGREYFKPFHKEYKYSMIFKKTLYNLERYSLKRLQTMENLCLFKVIIKLGCCLKEYLVNAYNEWCTDYGNTT